MSTGSAEQPMACDEALRLVSASLDGEASLKEADAVADHLVVCEACRQAAEAMESDDLLLRRLGPRGDLTAVGMGSKRPASSTRRRISLGLAAAAVLALVVAGPFWKSPSGPAESRLSESTTAASASTPVRTVDSSGEDMQRQLTEAMQQAEALLSSAASSSSQRSAVNPFREGLSIHPEGQSINPFFRGAASQGGDARRRRVAASPFGLNASNRSNDTLRGWRRSQNSVRWQRPSTP